MKIRLQTADGAFVSDTTPVLPIELTPVATWGTRIFLDTGETTDGGNTPIYREVMPTLCTTPDMRRNH